MHHKSKGRSVNLLVSGLLKAGDRGLTGTLELSEAALEISQMILGPAQTIWDSLVILLLD